MKMPTIKNLYRVLVIFTCGFMIAACLPEESTANGDFEKQVEDYLQKFPSQETYRYAMLQTGGDPARLNTWVNTPRGLLKAGEDKVVRSNNDTVYRMAWVYLGQGPVVLTSAAPSKKRFTSFQLQDDRNANYRNIIHPAGAYTLYHGEKPATITGQAVEVPSLLSAVITRIEVKDKNNPADLADALSVYDGLTIEGPAISRLPVVDLLSGFDERVVQEAEKRMQETKKTVPYSKMIAGPGQEPGEDISYLNFATGTKEGWGGPALSHSAYESWYTDASGETLDGSNGEYVLTTEAPLVKAFWSVTIYDSTTGRFHANDDDRYHINNTTAVKNEDGTYTFRFKLKCEKGDVNCLEVPAGPFDVAARYYLPGPEIMNGEWTMPKPVLKTSNLTPDVARKLAKDAWVFGLPLVMFEKQVDYSTYVTQAEATRAPINQFVHYRKFVDASNRSIVGFNVDNLYSLAWIDLKDEPLVLAVPAMGNRYWIMQIVDAWNGVPAAPGSRTHSGAAPHLFLIAGPDWQGVAPEGMEVLRSPTNLGGVGGRTYCAGDDDYAAVNKLQDQYTLTPLSAWGKPYTPPANVPLKKGVDGETLVNAQVMALNAEEFFSNLNRLLATNPPYPDDAPLLEKLRPLGIAPSEPFAMAGWSPEVRAAIEEGVMAGKAALAEEAKKLGKKVNNWGLTYDMGRYGTRYAYRAAWTFVGIGGNVIEDAFYPLTLLDSAGNPLTGEHSYTLTFGKGEWPPADAFWSLTMYDIDGYLVDNPLDRYAIGDRSGMKPNTDGSLTIYMQSESPGQGKEANWLPAPKTGLFKVALRLYVPRERVRNGDWVPPALARVD